MLKIISSRHLILALYVSAVVTLFTAGLAWHTVHAGGGGFALESTQQQNRQHLDVVRETNFRMQRIMDIDNPAQFEANANARRAAAEATMEAFLTGDEGNPMFIERYGQEKSEAGDIAYMQAVQDLSERYNSPYIGNIQSQLASYVQPASYSMSPESVALAQGTSFSWEAVGRVVQNPNSETALGQYYSAQAEVYQARNVAEQNFRDEAVGNNMINPVRSDCDENGQNCRTEVPAALVERIAGDAATAGSRLQEMGDSVGEQVDGSFANMGTEMVQGSSAQLGIGQDLGMNVGDLFNDLGLNPADFGLDPNAIFNDVINQIAGEFGIGNIDLSSPEAAAQSIVNAIGNEMGIGGLDISSPQAFAQSIANVIGSEMGINIDLSNPSATAQSVMNAVSSELGIGNIDLSNPQAAMQSIVNAALNEINSGRSTNFSDPAGASDIIEDVAESIDEDDGGFDTTHVTTLLNTASSIEEAHYALIQEAQESGSAELVEYVNSAADGELSLANRVLSNIVALNDLSLELQQIRDEANGDYSSAQVERVADIIDEYTDLRSEFSNEADIELLETELENI